MVMGELYIGPILATIPPKEDIVVVMGKYEEVGLKISTTLLCTMF